MVNYVFLSVYFYSVPNLRFNNNPYKKYNLYEFATRVTRKNKDNVSNLPLTISAQYGLVDQVSFFNKTVASKDMSGYYLLKNGEFAYNKSYSNDYPWGAIKRLDLYNMGCLSTLYICFKSNDNIVNSNYLVHYFESPKWHKQVADIAGEGARNHGLLNIAVNDFFNTKHAVPTIENQIKIARFLDLIEERIQTQIKIIDTLSSQKKQIRNLLFKDIHKNANCCIQDYVIYEQPQKYIVHSTDYLSYGKDYTPVLTANQSFILGYTLEKDGIYEKGDCIIFDDFTNENKYVDFPFKVKSSALKILQTKEGLMLKFFYEYLQFLNFESTDHKRHYLSEVAVTDISVPNLKEQTFVCKIFTSFDNKLRNEKALLEKYRLQKQFLLNNLFI
ncbi:hypothetical protein EUBIFOR_00871 [Holdemanella biformis DSM 3989]|uniref:Type I restriction modification DNA specificity domain protein n=1 Tax=Holdemanella biformis DSM 3989 TaxID=518637 RepID=B7C9L3_9FIRM|nr:hypothetical protein EUBIFOR_00871 [Holdemanella biformis DSM 3989]